MSCGAATPSAALILGVAYNSHDISGLFLEAYDRRRSTAFAAAYREILKRQRLPISVANIKDRE